MYIYIYIYTYIHTHTHIYIKYLYLPPIGTIASLASPGMRENPRTVVICETTANRDTAENQKKKKKIHSI